MQKHIVVAIAAALSVGGLAAPTARADREIVVQAGETMQSISLRYYGDEAHVSDITRYNDLDGPDLIFAGLRLVLPDLPPQDPAADPSAPGTAGTAGLVAADAPAGRGANLTGSTSATPPVPAGGPGTAAPLLALPVLSTPGSPGAALPGATTRAAASAPAADVPVPGTPLQSGLATWYGPGFNGQVTYCGDIYDQWGYTAASNTLPCNLVVVVTNQATGASVRVRINDRGGFRSPNIMDMSRAAFLAIAPIDQGVASITVSLPAR